MILLNNKTKPNQKMMFLGKKREDGADNSVHVMWSQLQH